jgi:hypothetical protein
MAARPISVEMATLIANTLAEGQLVQLDLGAKTELLDCRVLGFAGTTVILAPATAPEDATLEAMQAGSYAYLLVDAAGALQALRARLHGSAGPENIVVSVTDGFQLGQRRRYSRAPIELPVRLRPLAGGEEWESATRDLSAGGVRVARTGAPGEEADELEVVLEAAGGIRAGGKVVRRTDSDLSLRFTSIAEDAVVLLQQIAVAYYRVH